MKLTLIALSDAQQLLDFELDNKLWFEQFIPPRESDFYSVEGVKQHIREFLLDYHCNELVPMLIKSDDNKILGRLNVSNIDSKKAVAHLGYRVGHQAINQGVAKWAVSQLSKVLKGKRVKTIYAYAATTNPASQKVLTSNGFEAVKVVSNYAELHGEMIDCIEYRLIIR
ncbi:GNAT family N-acetyltransferase [Vibrio brasiliensis]|uniref:GNAT family N-acetyltransferase n=1 Tax=Vibrio brasiliensis TaxID=170652 RepID=UPI001EFC53A5|nr:GNAT family N-acetyltransferase [Vibrio brasiliensis]MCG9783010.1 GNAT family N-acetyltransferase [Vibrio brasiliensis]